MSGRYVGRALFFRRRTERDALPEEIAEKVEYVRSRGRRLRVEVRPDLRVIVRVPPRASMRSAEAFLREHAGWVAEHYERRKEKNASLPAPAVLSEEELKELKKQASAYIPDRVRHFAPLVGVTFGRITIRSQRSRWGSCSSKGNLNFNCLLMLTPPEVIDYVVVHELCHRKEMNHSPRFYAELGRVLPDHREREKWLKKNGLLLLMRLPS